MKNAADKKPVSKPQETQDNDSGELNRVQSPNGTFALRQLQEPPAKEQRGKNKSYISSKPPGCRYSNGN